MNNKNNNQNGSQSWMEIVSKYNFSDPVKSWWQLITSLTAYLLLWGAMIVSLNISYFITFILSFFAAGFLIRIFIIFHDCGHGSFFKSKNLNLIVGIITGLMAFTPYHKWHRDHKEHHSTVGNLDKRGVGDVKTLTIEEYVALSKWGRFKYRLYRHPIFLFGIAPFLIFVLQNRLTVAYMNKKERLYLHLSNLALIVTGLLIIWAIGWKGYLLIQLPVLYISAVVGVWLFYVQHQYEDVVWTRSNEWTYKDIALEGSSFYKLPRVLQWFTGNIGFHHIHHLSPRIPNYKLPTCHKENQIFQEIKPVTLFSSFRSLSLRLWDEKKKRLVGWKALRYHPV